MAEREVIFCDKDQCTGCECCVLACSEAHHQKFSPSLSRIRVEREEPVTIKAMACQQCPRPKCLQACPVGAIEKEEGLVKVDPEKCMGCGMCVEACPFGAITIAPAEGVAIKCELCSDLDEEPKCVEACIHDALEVREAKP